MAVGLFLLVVAAAAVAVAAGAAVSAAVVDAAAVGAPAPSDECAACGASTPELIRLQGFACEEHFVETSDSFVLALHRVRLPGRAPVGTKGTVVLQHGLLADSSDWVLNEDFNSYGFVLAKAGYDVWLLNSRGNRYSTNNTKLQPSQKEFWAWTWDQMGSIDVPTSLRYIRGVTPRGNRMAYMGGSQGTEILFAHASADPTGYVVQQLDLFVAFGPVAYISHCQDGLLRTAARWHLGAVLERFGFYDFLPSSAGERDWLAEVCHVLPSVCKDLVDSLAGIETTDLNQTRLPVYLSHIPSGTSTMSMEHYSQAIKADVFQMYDFGSAEANKQHYNQPTPPPYDLTKFPAKDLPVALFSGGKDKLADPTDVAHLVELLPETAVVHHTVCPGCGHLDWAWGDEQYKTTYVEILDLLEKYVAKPAGETGTATSAPCGCPKGECKCPACAKKAGETPGEETAPCGCPKGECKCAACSKAAAVASAEPGDASKAPCPKCGSPSCADKGETCNCEPGKCDCATTDAAAPCGCPKGDCDCASKGAPCPKCGSATCTDKSGNCSCPPGKCSC